MEESTYIENQKVITSNEIKTLSHDKITIVPSDQAVDTVTQFSSTNTSFVSNSPNP
jgi:hypothetical protein